MRVRIARVTVTKATGLEAVFSQAVKRNLAWLQGSGRVYADLEKVAGKLGYRVWAHKDENDEENSLWFAVRKDLIAEDGWYEDESYLSFESTHAGLGDVGLVGDDLFDQRNSVTLTTPSVKDVFDNYEYSEVLYSVKALQG